MIGTMMRRLIPSRIRTFIRSIDPGYQDLLRESAAKDEQLEEIISHNRDKTEELKQKVHDATCQLDNESLQALNDVGIFIVACARSGTSIMCDCFNHCRDVLVLGEASIYLHHDRPKFAEDFNRQHLTFNNRRGKGTYVSLAPTEAEGGLQFLQRMSQNYRYVGEKIAFGPHGKIGDKSFQEVCFEFQAKYFFFSHYFLIVRRPMEALWSMFKMFQDKSPAELIVCWLTTIKIQIDMFQSFPNAYFLFLEDLKPQTFITLGAILDIDFNLPNTMLCEENQRSTICHDEVPEVLADHAEICKKCHQIYLTLRDAISSDTLRYHDTVPQYVNSMHGFSSMIQDKIDTILKELAPAGAVVSVARPVRPCAR
ncbi:MAG: hypothetical protein IH983_00530 [Planctomycetes bacterium]|nr:hypothetical protein [Planctomycetota bacterium]